MKIEIEITDARLVKQWLDHVIEVEKNWGPRRHVLLFAESVNRSIEENLK